MYSESEIEGKIPYCIQHNTTCPYTRYTSVNLNLPPLNLPLTRLPLSFYLFFAYIYLLLTIHYAIGQLPTLPTGDTIRNEDHHTILNNSITRSDIPILYRRTKHRWRDPKC
jgi:hypothetical protein